MVFQHRLSLHRRAYPQDSPDPRLHELPNLSYLFIYNYLFWISILDKNTETAEIALGKIQKKALPKKITSISPLSITTWAFGSSKRGNISEAFSTAQSVRFQ